MKQLDHERKNSAGNAEEMREQMQNEIDDLKKQLFERTGQLESASITILERNEDIQKLKLELDGHLAYISELEAKIKELELIVENSKLSGADAEEKLRQEMQRLLKEIEDMKRKFKQDFDQLEQKMLKQKEQELKFHADKFEKMIFDQKAQAKKDKAFLENEHKKKVTQLEEDLKIARSGFASEREALEKKRTDMQAEYEKQIAEMKNAHESSVKITKISHSEEVDMMRTNHKNQLEDETYALKKNKEETV